MCDKALTYLLLFASFPVAFQIQQLTPESSTKLKETQKHGQLLFQQRCSVCHTMLSVTDRKTYGTRLYKDLLDGNEDLVRQSILNGREGLMPGFKYGLTAPEINDIIDYLKTVEKPDRPSAWY
jgi:mono/diheme cytochrome c family protein